MNRRRARLVLLCAEGEGAAVSEVREALEYRQLEGARRAVNELYDLGSLTRHVGTKGTGRIVYRYRATPEAAREARELLGIGGNE